MEQDLDSVATETSVIPTELENFIKTLEIIPEVINYISSEFFNPDEYYVAQGLDFIESD